MSSSGSVGTKEVAQSGVNAWCSARTATQRPCADGFPHFMGTGGSVLNLSLAFFHNKPIRETRLLQESVVDVADVPRQAALHISKCAAAGWVRDGSRRER